MTDTNLDPSITALTNRASTVAVTATARELMNISRLAPSLEQSENTDLEVAINARAEDLAPSATATELKSIGKAIGNVLEPETFVAGGTLPNQAQNSGNFLGTNGVAEAWGGLSVSTLDEVNISSILNDETLVYNNVSGQFENDSQVFRIQEIALTDNIPASGSFEGQVVFDQQTSELKYWDGSEWKVAAVVAAAGGGASIKSVIFDGSGDGFSVPDLTPTINGSDLRFGGVQNGGVPYTVECWIKRTGKSYEGGDTGVRDVILEKGLIDAAEEFALYVNKNNSIRWGIQGLGSNRITAPNDTIVMDQWHHIAVCGDSSDEHRMWVDGVQVGNTTWMPQPADYTFNDPDSHEPLRVGHSVNDSGSTPGKDWIGKIADLRILVGTALYTGNFTPPTSPLEKIADTVLLTARGDTITDESDLARTVTVLGDTAPDADSPYPASGGGSTSSALDLSTISWNTSVNPHTRLESVATYGDVVVIGVPSFVHDTNPGGVGSSWAYSSAQGNLIGAGYNGKAFLYNKSTDTTVELVQPSADIINQGAFGYNVAINDTYVAVLAREQTYWGITPKIYLYNHSGVYQNVRIEGSQFNTNLGSSAVTGKGIVLGDSYIYVLAPQYQNSSSSRVFVYDYSGTEIGYVSSGASDMQEFDAKGNTIITASSMSIKKWDISSLSGALTAPSWSDATVSSNNGDILILDDDYFVYANFNVGSGHFELRQMTDGAQVGSDFTQPGGSVADAHFGKFLSTNRSGTLAVSGRALSGKVYLYSHSGGVLTFETSVDDSSTGIGSTSSYGHTISISESSLVVGDRQNGRAHIFD